MFAQLAPQPCRTPTADAETLIQVFGVVIHHGLADARLRLRIDLSGSELPHCTVIEIKLLCEFSIRSSCLQEEFPHLLPPLLSSLSVRFLDQEFALAPGSDPCSCGLGIGRPTGPLRMREQAMVRSQGMSQGFAQVTQQVPTISYLNGLRSRPACGFGIDPAAVAADDLGTRMSSKPGSYGVGVAIGKQVDHPARLQVAQDRSIAMPLAPGPVVDAEHPWSLHWKPRAARMKLPQQSRPAGQQAKTLSKLGSSSTTQGKREPTQSFARPTTSSSIASRCTRQRFRKDLAPAPRLHAEEPSRTETDDDRQTVPGQICQASNVSAMNSSRRCSTRGTCGADTARLQPHLDRAEHAAEADQLDFRNSRDQRSWAHRQGAKVARATSVLRSNRQSAKNHQMCARTVEMSCSRSLELSGSRDGMDTDERARSEADRSSKQNWPISSDVGHPVTAVLDHRALCFGMLGFSVPDRIAP